MKILAVLICTVALATAAGNISLDGKWQIHSTVAGQDQDSTCSFRQKDANLRGNCTAADGSEKDLTGKIDGKRITWSYKSEYNGTPLTVQYEGTLNSDDKIVGTTSVPEFGVDGDFTANRAK